MPHLPPPPSRDFIPLEVCGRRPSECVAPSSWAGIRKPSHNQKCATAIGPSQLVQAPPPMRRPKENPHEGCGAWSTQSTPAHCRAWTVTSIHNIRFRRPFLHLQPRPPLTTPTLPLPLLPVLT